MSSYFRRKKLFYISLPVEFLIALGRSEKIPGLNESLKYDLFLLAQKINRLIKACTHSDNVCSSLQAQISARQVFQFSYNGICRVLNYFVSHSQQEYHIFRDSDILGTFE